jgi:uncharacterized DUF497 family protein
MLYFEWDSEKESRNIKKHGITFKEAATVFSDNLADTFYDPDHSEKEDRYILIGLSESRNILVVAFTARNDIIRIISARKATKNERRYYEDEK